MTQNFYPYEPLRRVLHMLFKGTMKCLRMKLIE